MKKIFLNMFMVVGLFVFSSMVHSAVITSIFGTGLDESGNPLAIGVNDLYYTVNENSGVPAQTLTNSSYIANNSNSQWIWQNTSGFPGDVTRTFKTSFDLTGFNLSSVEINGAWGTDNQGLDILVNGNSSGINLLGVIADNYETLTSFTINSGFVTGINTLEFIVQDNGGVAAFRTELSGIGVINSVPEPTIVWLFFSGLIGIIGLRRRYKKSV